jgi:hypothetical protein
MTIRRRQLIQRAAGLAAALHGAGAHAVPADDGDRKVLRILFSSA